MELNRRAFLKNAGIVLVLIPGFGTFTMIEGCSSSEISTAISVAAEIASVALPTVGAIITALSGAGIPIALATSILAGLTDAENGLAALSGVLKTYTAANASTVGAKVIAAINALIAQLSSLMAAFHVLDAATQAKLTALLQLVLTAVESWVPIFQTVSPNTAGVSVAKPTIMSKKQFRGLFNASLAAPTGNAKLDAITAGKKI